MVLQETHIKYILYIITKLITLCDCALVNEFHSRDRLRTYNYMKDIYMGGGVAIAPTSLDYQNSSHPTTINIIDINQTQTETSSFHRGPNWTTKTVNNAWHLEIIIDIIYQYKVQTTLTRTCKIVAAKESKYKHEKLLEYKSKKK